MLGMVLTGGTMTTRDDLTTKHLLGMVRRSIAALERHAADHDPWILAEMLTLQKQLDETIPRVVRQLRDSGYTWREIANTLETPEGTVRKRWRFA